MTLFQVTRITQARVLSHSGATSTRILHSSARVGRGISIGGGNAQSGSGSSSKSTSGGSPFSALRDELKKQPSKEQPSTSQEARFEAIRQDTQTSTSAGSSATATEKAVEENAPSTPQEAELEYNKQAQKQEFQQSRDETWTAMSERIRLAQKEEQKQEEQAKAAVRKTLKQRASTAQKTTTRAPPKVDSSRIYSFDNTIDAQMFVNGVTSTLIQQSPTWQGSITLQRTSQGHATVDMHLAEGSALAHSLDRLAARFQSSSSKSQPSTVGQRTQAFRAGSIPQASQSASVMSGEHSDSSLHETIDGRVPVTIQGEQVPGNKQDSIEARTGNASQGPVGQALGVSDSHPTSPIEDHTPVPNLHNQSKREFATLFGSGSGGLHSGSQSLASLVGLGRRPSSGHALFGNQKRLLATSHLSIQLSQSTWSQIMNEREYLRVDDYIPVEIDASQLGKKRSIASL
ncbi:uncharacterized protein FA14DRAFT_160966 [Meira miltonrushii]|uniref:Uncharacterized protein n=1 Tax=Meira miltonrushii TaxID=1280837 RepID=A0A316VFI2_9BASI|nr:uncharacterized protein FA14DRAFT_160966 [Meira miltonrushii]PWN36074.1 hypothetical protein FA14DRAFT_160966 [Meira miltonrushii]